MLMKKQAGANQLPSRVQFQGEFIGLGLSRKNAGAFLKLTFDLRFSKLFGGKNSLVGLPTEQTKGEQCICTKHRMLKKPFVT